MEESSDHKRITKKLSYQPPKRRYHILSSIKKGRRKTCPEIFSKEGDSDEKALYYQQLADKHFFLGNHDEAATYYSVLLDRDFQKSFKHGETDVNNNENNNPKSRKWAEEYLALKVVEVNEKIMVSPTEPEGYLEKAAVLFFENQWNEAREVLDAGLNKCSRKALLKTTLNELNKVTKALEKHSNNANSNN